MKIDEISRIWPPKKWSSGLDLAEKRSGRAAGGSKTLFFGSSISYFGGPQLFWGVPGLMAAPQAGEADLTCILRIMLYVKTVRLSKTLPRIARSCEIGRETRFSEFRLKSPTGLVFRVRRIFILKSFSWLYVLCAAGAALRRPPKINLTSKFLKMKLLRTRKTRPVDEVGCYFCS